MIDEFEFKHEDLQKNSGLNGEKKVSCGKHKQRSELGRANENRVWIRSGNENSMIHEVSYLPRVWQMAESRCKLGFNWFR